MSAMTTTRRDKKVLIRYAWQSGWIFDYPTGKMSTERENNT